MRRESKETPFLDQIEDSEEIESGVSRAAAPIKIHADVRRALEIRDEMKRLREDLSEFEQDPDDLDDILDN